MNEVCSKSPTGLHVFGQGFNIARSEEYLWCIHCERRWSKEEVSEIVNEHEKREMLNKIMSGDAD